jgi:hypothetical protein
MTGGRTRTAFAYVSLRSQPIRSAITSAGIAGAPRKLADPRLGCIHHRPGRLALEFRRAVAR